jgi:hypothetical protein
MNLKALFCAQQVMEINRERGDTRERKNRRCEGLRASKKCGEVMGASRSL